MTDMNSFYTYGSSAWIAIQGAALAFAPDQVSHFYLTSHVTTEPVVGGAARAISGQHHADSAFTFLRVLGGIFMVIALGAFMVRPHRAPSQLPSPRESTTPLTTTLPRQFPGLGSVILPMTMGLHAVTAIYSYTRYMTENVFAWQLLMAASTFWLFTGIFALLFSGETPVSDNNLKMRDGKKTL